MMSNLAFAPSDEAAELFYRRRNGSLVYRRFPKVEAAVAFAKSELNGKELWSCTIECDGQSVGFDKHRSINEAGPVAA